MDKHTVVNSNYLTTLYGYILILAFMLLVCFSFSVGTYLNFNRTLISNEKELDKYRQELNFTTQQLEESSSRITQLEEQIVKLKYEKVREQQVSRSFTRQFIAKASAYTPREEECGANPWITSTGTRVEEGRTIAVNPKIIPYGSTLEVICPTFPEINGIYTAEDTGGGMVGNVPRVDIFMNSYDKAIQFGRREVTIRILEEGG